MMTKTMNLSFIVIVKLEWNHWSVYYTLNMTIHKSIEGVHIKCYQVNLTLTLIQVYENLYMIVMQTNHIYMTTVANLVMT